MKKLNEQQKLFVKEYLKDLNATQAAIRAGYSEKTSHSQGPRLLENVEIASQIQKAMDKRASAVEISAQKVLQDILNVADVDIAQAYDENGRLKNIHDIPVNVRKAISGIKVYEEFEGAGKGRIQVGEVREVKFWDKIKSLELLGKHLKLFTEKMEHSGQIDSVVSVQPFDLEARKKQLKGEE